MKEKVERPDNPQTRSWASSIFPTIDNLIKHDVAPSNKVFAIACGAIYEPYTFDLLGTLKTARQRDMPTATTETEGLDEILESILNTLEEGGAPNVKDWADINQLKSVVPLPEATTLRTMLNSEAEFKQKFIDRCLPVQCRQRFTSPTALGREAMRTTRDAWSSFLPRSLSESANNRWETATVESISDAVEKGFSLLWELCARSVGPEAVMGVHDASDILHGYTDDQTLTEEQTDRLMKTVEPFIYGRTPLRKALSEARSIFGEKEYINHRKLLFVLSDGDPTDEEEKDSHPDFAEMGVHVMCCYITTDDLLDPKRLYSSQADVQKSAGFMFNLSTSVSTQQLPSTIFVKRGWTVDVVDNETKLFCQVNHPDLIEEFCNVAREMVCSQDALADILGSVYLDLYINQANDEFGAKLQIGGTCYANAAAAVMHLATKRITAREGGYPDFFHLREDMIARHGKTGAYTFQVLQEYCPNYRLRCQAVEIEGALRAVASKRPVVALFALTDPEWDRFSEFYETTPKGILTETHLDKSNRDPEMELKGHAVVLTSFNSSCLRLMNSWGTGWADQGFFRVRNSDVLDIRFIDVYWTVDDLLESEVEAYRLEGPKLAGEHIRSLTGLRAATFECPLCGVTSGVTEYRGKLDRACCPCCHGEFDCTGSETNDLVLNLYLTSLCD